MNIKEFIERANATSTYFGAGTGGRFELSYLGLGLAGEAGEVAGMLRKVLEKVNSSMRPDDKEIIEKYIPKLADELGDVLWFALKLIDALELDPEEVMEQCDLKLSSRFKDEYAKLPTYEVEEITHPDSLRSSARARVQEGEGHD